MKYITNPWEHQRKDVDFIDEQHIKFWGLFYDMGAGKTKTAIDILRAMFNKKRKVLKTLIICPIVVVENWKREFKVHSKIPQYAIQIVDGKTKLNGSKVKTAQLKLKLEQIKNKDAAIIIINTESVGNKNLWPLLLDAGFEALVVDESHRFKNPSATRTKALHKLCRQAQLTYRYILTGTPILQSALDIWSQFFILDKNILGENFFTFRFKYFYDANASMPSHIHFPNWKAKDRAYYKKLGVEYNDDMADLNKIIYKHASRVMKDDCLDLPPFINAPHVLVGMGKEQSRIYKEMRDDLVATLENGKALSLDGPLDADLLDNLGVMSADLAIVKTLRLMQIIAGIFTDSEGVTTLLDTNRIKALEEILIELCSNKENKIIVWTTFKATYEAIAQLCDKLEIKFTMLTGLQDKDEKQDNVDAFNNDKSIQVLIANQGAGGTGVNLTASNYSIYYTRSFNLEHDLQSEARNYRGGQTRKVTRIDLVTPETIDEKILEALAEKKALAENILEVKQLTRGDILGAI